MLLHLKISFPAPYKKPGANTGRVLNLLFYNFINMDSVIGRCHQKEDAR